MEPQNRAGTVVKDFRKNRTARNAAICGDFSVCGQSERSDLPKIISFRICDRRAAPLGPQNGPEARPGEATIRPQERKRAPQGAPVIAAERARNFFSHFFAREKNVIFPVSL